MIKIIKKILPKYIKRKIVYALSEADYYNQDNKNEKKIIVTLGADYGNIGDVAITYAQIEFMKKHFPNYKIIEFPIGYTYKYMKSLKRICNRNDIITTLGGGNMGDLYNSIEECRRYIINSFPNNKIISFPQTIDFSETRTGKKELQKTIKAYSKHKDLHIFAREKKSFDIMKKCFTKNNVYICPDIVLSLKKENNKIERENIVVCLRDDLESKFGQADKDILIKDIKGKYTKTVFQDTYVGDEATKKGDKYKIFEDILNTFCTAKVVLTDRLHGMIFCIITKTPCVVLPNANHKIKETYDSFLSDSNYIKFVENFDIKNILENIDALIDINKEEIKQPEYNTEYMQIVDVIKGGLHSEKYNNN